MEGQLDQQSSRVKRIAVVATVGLLSAALGFAAEATKSELAEVKDISANGCIFPSHSRPTTLAVIAVVALLGFRVYCPGIRSQSLVVQLSRYLSWVAWFVAMSFYVAGLFMINNEGENLEYHDRFESYYSCNHVKPGIFGAGASFALASIILEIMYLVATQHQNDKTMADSSTQTSTVAMC